MTAVKVQPPPAELKIAGAAALLGVSASTVRRWGEDGTLSPCRRLPSSGHRRYSRDDVEHLKRRLEHGDLT